MGVCKERFEYGFEVQKQVPGTNNFVRVSPVYKSFYQDATLPQCVLSLSQLCNSDPNVPIRFALVDKN